MKISATALRADIYRVIDHALATGDVVEIERNGRVVRLVPDHAPSRLDRLVRREVVVGDPDDIVSVDWSHAWVP